MTSLPKKEHLKQDRVHCPDRKKNQKAVRNTDLVNRIVDELVRVSGPGLDLLPRAPVLYVAALVLVVAVPRVLADVVHPE